MMKHPSLGSATTGPDFDLDWRGRARAPGSSSRCSSSWIRLNQVRSYISSELQDPVVPPPGSVSTRLDLIYLQSSRILDPSQPGQILYIYRAPGSSSSSSWIRPNQVISYIYTELQDLVVPSSGSVPNRLYLISLQIIRIQQQVFLPLDPSQPGYILYLYRSSGSSSSSSWIRLNQVRPYSSTELEELLDPTRNNLIYKK